MPNVTDSAAESDPVPRAVGSAAGAVVGLGVAGPEPRQDAPDCSRHLAGSHHSGRLLRSHSGSTLGHRASGRRQTTSPPRSPLHRSYLTPPIGDHLSRRERGTTHDPAPTDPSPAGRGMATARVRTPLPLPLTLHRPTPTIAPHPPPRLPVPTPRTLPDFVRDWHESTQSERQGAQSHFNQLCDILGVDNPGRDTRDDSYAFEAATTRAAGGSGRADVWKRGYFAWEYKSKGEDLRAAYTQLLGYRDALDNPPLLVTCDFERFEVHTNFTNTTARVYSFTLADLLQTDPLPGSRLSALDVLRAVYPPRAPASEPHARAGHRGGGEAVREACLQPACPRRQSAGRRALPHPTALLPLRRGRRPAARAAPLAPRRRHAQALLGLRASGRPTLPADGERRLLRRRSDPALQRRPLHRRRGADAHGRRPRRPGVGLRARVGPDRAVDLRHAVRAQPGPRQPRAARRALHQPRRHRHGRRAGADGAAPARVVGPAR